jgi:predicted N-acetyltransferase YhbS
MEPRLLKREEIIRLSEIDRSEVIDHIFQYREGNLILIEESCVIPDWNQWTTDEIGRLSANLQELFDNGGFVFGVFDNQRLVGIGALDSKFIGRKKDQLDLAGLWVSSEYRRKGVATKLLFLIKEKAKGLGAKKLYISATPSLNTVTFYLNRGAKITSEIDAEKFKLEPEDIHLEMKI